MGKWIRVKRLSAWLAGGCGIAWAVAGCASLESAAPSAEAPVLAEEPLSAPPPEGYAWEILARRAADRSGEAQALLLEAVAERHQAAVDTAWRDPQLRIGTRWGELDEETPGRTGMRTDPSVVGSLPEPFIRNRQWETRSSDGYEAGLRVYVSNPFVNQWLRKRGAAWVQAKESAAQEAAYAVYCEVRTLCLEAATLREEIDLLEQMAVLRTQVRDIRGQQAAVGRADALELIQAVTRVAALRSDIREKEAEYRQLIRQIAVLANVPVEQVRLRPPGAEPLPDASAWDADRLADLAVARRPDLARAEHERSAAEHGVGAAKAGLLPWFDYVEGAYNGERTQINSYEDNRTGYDQTDQDATEWQLRLAVNLPIFDWGGKRIRLSQAKLAATQARAQTLKADLHSEVSGVLEDYRGACAERDRLQVESQHVQAVMMAKIEALAKEPSVQQEDLLAVREDVLAYVQVRMQAQRECLRLAQRLETLSGGPLDSPP